MTAAGTRIASYGLAVSPSSGWEAAIFRRRPAAGEITFPVLQAATVPLPPVRGDYGSGVVELLGAGDVFVSLLEFGPGAAGSPLFPPANAVPRLTADLYRPKALQRVIRGQAGVQRFFTLSGRAFCLYSVIGSFARRDPLSILADQLVGSLEISQIP